MMFKETEVSKANIDVSEAGKPSAGARILKGQILTKLVYFYCCFWKLPSELVIERCFKEVSSEFSASQENLKGKLQCFNKVFFHKVIVAWNSSQLPERKEGLLHYKPSSTWYMTAECIKETGWAELGLSPGRDS